MSVPPLVLSPSSILQPPSVSLRFHSRKEKLTAPFSFFFIIILLDGFKSHKTEIAKSGTVYSVFLIAALLSRAESGD
jgi:hypothetical protein